MNSIQEIRGRACKAVKDFTTASKLLESDEKIIPIKSFEQSAVLQKASELKPKPINWIWSGWIAGGKLHLLSGVAGTGMNRYQYSRHFPTSLGTAVQILPEKVHCYNYGA